jgi:hypothetical protein
MNRIYERPNVFSCVRRVSSPRVSKGSLNNVSFGINERLANAALAHARATDTADANWGFQYQPFDAVR